MALMDNDTKAVITSSPQRRSGLHRCGNRLWVIAVATNIDAQIGLFPDVKGVAQSIADYACFTPCWNKDCNASVERPRRQLIALNRRGLRFSANFQPQPDGIDKDVIQGTDEEENPGKQKQFVLDQRQPLPKIECPQTQADPSLVEKAD